MGRWILGFKLWFLILVVMVTVLGSCLPRKADAMQPLTEQGCTLAAAVLMTARALSVAGVPRDKSERAMADMYAEELHQLFKEALDAAYEDNEKRPARIFALTFYRVCISNSGETTKFFGTKV